MPSNKVAFLLILLGLVPLAISAQAVFFSGSEVAELQLRGKQGRTESVSVSPEMSPVRLLISMDYGSRAYSTVQRYIAYVVTARTTSGDALWIEDGRASVASDKKVISNKTHYSSLQTFDIRAPMDIVFDYEINSENLRYKGGYLTVKRNVSRHNWLITLPGLLLLVGGILLFANNQRK